METDIHGYGHLQGDSRAMAYQEPIPRGPPQHVTEQTAKSKDSVVIKVGMVGDAQIGKTSLMVKYVEGSWDEDYIQTLGQSPPVLSTQHQLLASSPRGRTARKATRDQAL